MFGERCTAVSLGSVPPSGAAETREKTRPVRGRSAQGLGGGGPERRETRAALARARAAR